MEGETERQLLATDFAGMRAVTVKSNWTTIADAAGVLNTFEQS